MIDELSATVAIGPGHDVSAGYRNQGPWRYARVECSCGAADEVPELNAHAREEFARMFVRAHRAFVTNELLERIAVALEERASRG